MGIRAVRAFLAISVVGVFMFITAFMAIFPLVTPAKVDLGQYADFFAKTASVYTGIIGVIIGYYFGRSTDRPDQPPPSHAAGKESLPLAATTRRPEEGQSGKP
jgi:hypothetical protein